MTIEERMRQLGPTRTLTEIMENEKMSTEAGYYNGVPIATTSTEVQKPTEWRVNPCANGFVVTENFGSWSGKRFVAKDADDLANLMKKLTGEKKNESRKSVRN